MKNHYIHMFEYNDWANKAAARSIKETANIVEQAVSIFGHIVNAQQLWLNRALEKSTRINPWQSLSMDESIILSSQSTNEWLGFLKSITENDLQVSVKYVNSKGDKYENTISQILTQVINHAAYHRGQIANIVRKSGGTPALTDYIVFVR